jgi:hypothetical protein
VIPRFHLDSDAALYLRDRASAARHLVRRVRRVLGVLSRAVASDVRSYWRGPPAM